jgi:serine/threonine-protein kinase
MLQPGTRIGNYEVISTLGAGGMGQVFRARDTKLGREVAIKVLPEAFSSDEERLARFEREAKLLAALSHPNVATLYELEERDGVPLLVMELVEGETLEARIARGPLAVEDAIPLFVEIANGLEAAHEKGIIHRDLKPANIKIQPNGRPKILDFGLAKVLAEDPSRIDPAESPTATKGTALGVILGTAHYMSPEQARGGAVDHRTDVWAFGCCLYEALTGKKAYEGSTVTDILAAILTRAPDLDDLPSTTPPRIRELIGKCVQKQPGRRLRDIGDARFDLEAPQSERTLDEPQHASDHRKYWTRNHVIGAFVAGATAVALGAFLLLTTQAVNPDFRPIRLSIDTSAEGGVDIGWGPSLAMSPDGSKIAFTGRANIYVRSLDAFASTLLPGTQAGYNIFFSADGRRLGFISGANNLFSRIALDTGTIELLTSLNGDRGASATWGDQETVIFTRPPVLGLQRLSRSDTALVPMTDPKNGKVHLDPELLPGEVAVLFSISTWQNPDDTSVAVRSLTTGDERILITGGSTPKYSPTGHLVYESQGSLYAVPFDINRLEITGASAKVVEGVAVTPYLGTAHYSFARNGTLAYVPAVPTDEGVYWVSRSGEETPVAELAGRRATHPSLSLDGQLLAVRIGADLWILDRRTAALRRLTVDASVATALWTPDGQRIAFSSNVDGQLNIYLVEADGTGAAERLTNSPHMQRADSWSLDGRTVLVSQMTPNWTMDVWTMSLDDRTLRPLLNSPASESYPQISPDGRWLAYQSNESGRDEIYVQSFPGPGGKWQVSTKGGAAPKWSPKGSELFYFNGTNFMASSVTTQPTFQAGPERELFSAAMYDIRYDVAPDGKSFIMGKTTDPSAYNRVNVVVNWFEELRRLVPTEN